MPAKQGIRKTLRFCERAYQRAVSPTEQQLYAKLALLELAGWIEMSVDDLVKKRTLSKITDPGNRASVDDAIQKVFSFDYSAFRKLVVLAIGMPAFDKVEKKLCGNVKGLLIYSKFKADINNLKTERDRLAHTHVRGVALLIPAPSVIRAYFDNIYEGLALFQKKLNS